MGSHCASTARGFIEAMWRDRVMSMSGPLRDAKTELQEWAQGRGLPLPSYSEIDRQGPPHDPVFTISVQVEGQPPRSGKGRSKRIAEQDAAAQLLAVVKGNRK